MHDSDEYIFKDDKERELYLEEREKRRKEKNACDDKIKLIETFSQKNPQFQNWRFLV